MQLVAIAAPVAPVGVLYACVLLSIASNLPGCSGPNRRSSGDKELPTTALECSAATSKGELCVAEIKPHYQCARNADALKRVKIYIKSVVDQGVGLIALLQFEARYDLPEGYAAFGASCGGRHPDPVVVLVNERQFSIQEAIGNTVLKDYSMMPFVGTGSTPSSHLDNCVSDPRDSGVRAYAGAVLKHRASGNTFCVVSGTFPHCRKRWYSYFVRNIKEKCHGKQLLVIADTNAACEREGSEASHRTSMQDISKTQSAGWGTCSDPGAEASVPTCCHDISGRRRHPEARWWYDRIALCSDGPARGGVKQFQVKDSWVCGTDQEHHFTSALVQLDLETSLGMEEVKIIWQ